MQDAPAATKSTTPGRFHLRADLTAALTVTLVGIPQCLAYALMSGLPPAYGLVTAAVPGLVAALVGLAPQIVTGPTNTTGLLILVSITPFLGPDGLITEAGLPALATLTLLAGTIRVVLALAGGAALIGFIPESVLAGFTTGAGVLIGAMQLDEGLGLPAVRGSGLLSEVSGVGAQLMDGIAPALPALGVTLATILVIALGKRYAPRWPMALLAVLAAGLAAGLLHLDAGVGLPLVMDRSVLPAGWPPGALPSLDLSLIGSLLAPAAAISVIGTLELAIVTRFGKHRPKMSRELHAQGWANVAGAFVSAFPASASLSRSALLQDTGVRTRLGSALQAVLTVPVLLFAGDLVGFIPQASLAGVLMITAWGMLDFPRMRRMFVAAPATRLLLLATLVATLTLPLDWAILGGAGLGLAIHLARTTKPRVRLLRPDGYRLVPLAKGEPADAVVAEVSGDLYYASVAHLRRTLERDLPPGVRTLIVDLSYAHELRFAALLTLEEQGRKMRKHGGRLVIVGANEEFRGLLERTDSGLTVIAADSEPGASLRRCLHDLELAPRWPPEHS